MKAKCIPILAGAVLGSVAASVDGALVALDDFLAIDVNSGTAITAAGFVALDASGGDGSSVTVDGVTVVVGSADGSRNRNPGDSNDLTRDFVFDDGNGQAVLLEFINLPVLGPGLDYRAEVWSYDDNASVGAQIVGISTLNTNSGPLPNETIFTDSFAASPTDPYTFDFDDELFLNNATRFSIFTRESPNGGTDRARLNGVRLTVVPEASSTGLLALAGLLGLRHRRR